jgi:hypothetical protein
MGTGMRKTLIGLLAAAALLANASVALAHHGWAWTTGGNIDLTGVIKTATLGNPHGVLTVDVDGTVWTVEVGQPWRHDRAGLKESLLSPGTEIRAIGEPAADIKDKRMKVERLFIGGREYKLYPERD